MHTIEPQSPADVSSLPVRPGVLVVGAQDVQELVDDDAVGAADRAQVEGPATGRQHCIIGI